MRRTAISLSCAMMMYLCSTVYSQERNMSDSLGTSATVSARYFQKGKTWRRITSVRQNVDAMVPRTGKVIVDYSVVEGYVDGECATEQVIIEVKSDDRRIPKDNNPFRLVLDRNGRYKCIMFRRGDIWHEYGKVQQPKEPAVVIVMNDTFGFGAWHHSEA